MDEKKFVSRGGLKLEHALKEFNLDVKGLTVLDIGSSTGGFVDCLLQHGAAKIYSVDTAYGELSWKLRQHPKVFVIERTNIMHMPALPEKVDMITIDVTFTPLSRVLPLLEKFLKPGSKVIALLKPQYENQKLAIKNKGVVPPEFREEIVNDVVSSAKKQGWEILGKTKSPIEGKDGNTEYLLYLSMSSSLDLKP